MSTVRVVEKLAERFELSQKDVSSLDKQYQFSDKVKPLLAESAEEKQKINKTIQMLKYQIKAIESDPDFGDPVLGTNIVMHEKLRKEHAVLQTQAQKLRLQSRAFQSDTTDNDNANTYQAPTLR